MPLRVAANAYDFPCTGELTPDNSALIVIDMQVDFCGEGGLTTVSDTDLAMMREPIEPTRRVLAAARAYGMPVIYTREGHRPDGAISPPSNVSAVASAVPGSGIARRLVAF